MPIAVIDSSSGTAVTYYIHTGHLDEPQVMTNAAKAKVWDAYVTPFGSAKVFTTATANTDLRLPGQWYQAEAAGSGLNQNGYRDYDPTLGRYIEADPLGLGGGQNPYAYVDGQVYDYTDPLGLGPIGRIVGSIAGPEVGAQIGGNLGKLIGPEGAAAGIAVGGLLGQRFGPLIGDALEEELFHKPTIANSDADLQRRIEYIANTREYHGRCDEQPPPTLTDPCERAKWNLRKAQDCKALRQANTNRWHNGQDNFHSPQLAKDLDAAIARAEKAVKRVCRCE